MKEVSKNVDIAVIFKKITNKNITLFEPKFITIGRLNKETMQFTDLIDQVTYNHLVNQSDTPYHYGLRIKLKDLMELYGIDDRKELFKTYLKELKQRRYYFAYANGKINNNNLVFISEDKKYHTTLKEQDKDLTRILNINDPFYDINKVIANIKDHIIGQDEAIEELISILWKNSRKENKNNIMLIGPTGVGKTELIRTLEKSLNIPITTVDVSNYTKTGYKGEDVTDILKIALSKCDGDINQLENSIIVLDEFDKLAKKAQNDDVTTTGVQHELLKIIEDGEYTIELGDGTFYTNQVTINTKGITFIVAGAFSELFEEEKISRPIGIGAKPNVVVPTSKKKVITTDDLSRFGIISEIIGRLHNVIVLNPLSLENLISIMKNPNYYALNDTIKLFDELGIKVQIHESVYEKIAKLALDKKTGARALVGSIENLFSRASLDAKRNSLTKGYNYLEITDETVLDNNKYILKKIKKEQTK